MVGVKSVFDFCGFSGANCFKEVVVIAEGYVLAVYSNVRMPFFCFFVPVDSADTAFVIAIYSPVALVFCSSSQREISPSIVVPYVVRMINLLRWKVARHIQEGKSMRKVPVTFERDSLITGFIQVTCLLFSISSIPSCRVSFIDRPGTPCKITCIRIVMKQFFKAFLSNHANLPSTSRLLEMS